MHWLFMLMSGFVVPDFAALSAAPDPNTRALLVQQGFCDMPHSSSISPKHSTPPPPWEQMQRAPVICPHDAWVIITHGAFAATIARRSPRRRSYRCIGGPFSRWTTYWKEFGNRTIADCSRVARVVHTLQRSGPAWKQTWHSEMRKPVLKEP